MNLTTLFAPGAGTITIGVVSSFIICTCVTGTVTVTGASVVISCQEPFSKTRILWSTPR